MDTKRLVESAVRKYIEEYTPDRNYSQLNDVYKKSNQGAFLHIGRIFKLSMKGINESRTLKTIRNVVSGLGSKIIIFVFAFAVRTTFVRVLGAEYNGINGLFTNIFSVICFADIGLENALSFSLYKELKNGNRKKILELVSGYKKIYMYFAIFIALIGMFLMFFLRYVVNSSIGLPEIYLYYILYLANAVATYLFVYKTVVLSADQNVYIYNFVFTADKIIQYLAQLFVLILWKNMLLYLVIQLICTLGQNIVLNYITCEKYSYLKKIPENDNKGIDKVIISNVKDTIIYRLANVMINNTDNIIISTIIGTYFAGLYSNYYMLVQYIAGIIYIAGNGVVASVGNLNAEKDLKKTYQYFKTINLIYSIIGNIYLCCFVNCIQQFVPIWIGEEYLLDNLFMYCLVSQFYIGIIMRPVCIFRETFGLFSKVKISMMIAALINIILSFVLGDFLGITGVVLASITSIVSTQFWYEPIILFKYMNIDVNGYYKQELKYLVESLLLLLVSRFVCNWIGTSLIDVIMRGIVSGGIALIGSVLLNINTDGMKLLINKARLLIKK